MGTIYGGLYQEMAAKGIRTERKPPVDEEERIEDSRQRRMAAADAESEPAQTFKQYTPEIQAEQSESFKPYDLETPGQAEQSESFKQYIPEMQGEKDGRSGTSLKLLPSLHSRVIGAKRPNCGPLSPTKVGQKPSAERLSHSCCLTRLKPQRKKRPPRQNRQDRLNQA